MPRLRSLPLDPGRSAIAVGLAHANDRTPGFTRRRPGEGFIYLDSKGKRVNRPVEVEGSTVHFRFTDKSGVRDEVEINDCRLPRIVHQCHDLPDTTLLNTSTKPAPCAL